MARKAEQHKSELIDKAAALAAARLSGDKAKAAERLGIGTATLCRKLKE